MDAMSPPAEDRFRSFLETEARRLGFDAVGIASARTDDVVVERFDTFVEEGRYGTMGWIAETAARRRGVAAAEEHHVQQHDPELEQADPLLVAVGQRRDLGVARPQRPLDRR